MLTRTRGSLMGAALVLAGCRTSPAVPPEPTNPPVAAPPVAAPPAASPPAASPEPTNPPTGPLAVTIRGLAMTGGALTPTNILSGAKLVSGDFFAFHVSANRPAHLYVLQFLADGTRELLSPAEQSEPIPGGVEVRIPSDPDAWFRLDQAVGEEHIYLVASERPLAAADPELAALVDDIRDKPTAPAQARTPPAAPPQTDARPAGPRSGASRSRGAEASPARGEKLLPLRAKGVEQVQFVNGHPVHRASFTGDGAGAFLFTIHHQ